MFDFALLAIAGVAVFGQALLGLLVTTRPPSKQRRIRYEVAFCVLGAIGLVAVVWGGIRTANLQDQIAAEIQNLKNQLAARSISEGQENDIVQRLTVTEKPSRIDVNCNMGDPEGCRYASQWVGVLHKAGWPTTGLTFTLAYPPLQGVIVYVKDANHVTSGVLDLLHALNDSDVRPSLQNNALLPESAITLSIGTKPNIGVPSPP